MCLNTFEYEAIFERMNYSWFSTEDFTLMVLISLDASKMPPQVAASISQVTGIVWTQSSL